MQRYSRDRDRDDEGRREERGSQARNEDRYSQSRQRGRRDEFGGQRESDYDRSSRDEATAYGMNQSPGRWRESNPDRDRFEETYGRGGRNDDDQGNWNESGRRVAWQPGSQQMESRRAQYGETEYGGYGPRYGSSYSGGALHGSGYGTYGGGSQYGSYGIERGDDRYGRQGYGQSGWQQDHERGQQHRFDPDYQQWREEQIRNLDDDYRTYRQERYRKFSEEFDAWRKKRESMSPREGSHIGLGQPGAGQPGTGQPGSETGTTDAGATGRDSLGVSRSTR